ncbi:hypothetical protein H4R34_002418 [Dimargaris verticillata]|uniref:Carbohydrate kinase PfkB domain-containing protein n=1 Tax=Dimargaris verticillata TaxID=2761393 RepID=A0A9W8EA03_9FUNG|nr:hypothetical protein H4R34_002418 [Dimargaris verticillata]
MSKPCRPILILGPNAACQTTLFFEEFRPGLVNRAYKKSHSIGGKAIGGDTGEYINKILNAKEIDHVDDHATRTCTTVLDASTGAMTELIEPSSHISAQEIRRFEDYGRQLIENGGSYPHGMTSQTFAKIAQLKPKHCLLYLDAVKQLEPILATKQVDVIKINGGEFGRMVDELGLGTMSLEDDKFDETHTTKLPALAFTFMAKYHVQLLAVTNGPNRAFLFCRESQQYFTFRLPDLVQVLQGLCLTSDSPLLAEKHTEHNLPPTITLEHHQRLLEWEAENDTCVARLQQATNGLATQGGCSPNQNPGLPAGAVQLLLNPLGAGDTANGVFLCELLKAKDYPRAFAKGLAAATASCLVTDYTGYFDLSIMESVYQQIVIEPHDFQPHCSSRLMD